MLVGSAADKRMKEQVDLFGACNADPAVEDALLLRRIPESPRERRVQGGAGRGVRAARGGDCKKHTDSWDMHDFARKMQPRCMQRPDWQ
ncbi:NAD synthase [Giardia duodenalis assemblage B]|uniref:NAD synthase n=1 Tax=Giardia duodenalis assemblage B TaxID=1394984 RepID=A0A132NMK8_GIAIN|nr:NAD synthase [Giardia intestinalis assemblage B]